MTSILLRKRPLEYERERDTRRERERQRERETHSEEEDNGYYTWVVNINIYKENFWPEG